MIRLFLPLLLMSSLALTGQDAFLRELSAEVCSCLNERTSQEVASECLKSVATTKAKAIRQRYALDVAFSAQRDKLTELMLDELLEECPVLKTVRPQATEDEFRWADGRRSAPSSSPQLFRARKRPPADTARAITSEPPFVWRAAGTLLAQPGSRGLRLRTTEDKKELRFELPAAVARRRDFDPGDEVNLTYRREWRPGEGRVVLVVTEIL